MLGMILWKEHRRGKHSVTIGERCVLHVRFACAEIERSERTPGAVLRRRVRGAVRRLVKMGVTEVVLPESFEFSAVLEEGDLRPVSTLPLRRMMAADWLRLALEEQGITGTSVRIAVAAEELTGELVQAVTELSLRYRYVLLDLSRGGEELTRHLRREYGVSLLLSPSQEQVEGAEAAVLFAPRQAWSGKNPVFLQLFDERKPLPGLALPPAIEDQMPCGLDRGQLLAVLRQAGALRPGQITVERVHSGSGQTKEGGVALDN